MNTGRFIKIVFALLILLTYGAEQTWADKTIDASAINITIKDGGSSTIVPSVSALKPDASGNYFEVTLTVNPAAGYELKSNNITVQPLADPAGSRSRAPGIAETLTVTGSGNSFSFKLPERYDGALVTATFTLKSFEKITKLSEIKDENGSYEINGSFEWDSRYSNIGTSSKPFKGVLEGNFVPFELKKDNNPLFEKVDGAIIKNVIISEASVSTSGITGAICCTAIGASRIYNCGILSGTVGSTGTSTADNSTDCCGGLVGLLDGTSRVINCYSFATITDGNRVGGIVGYNNVATSTDSSKPATYLKTMVMNCMFYGDITGGNKVSPVYGGKEILNIGSGTTLNTYGLNTYNYYAYDELKTVNSKKIDYPNCALAAKKQYLNRFEIYRQLLNGNRKLAALYATGDASKGEGENTEMAKWVLDTSIKPYPILKKQGYYPSVVNNYSSSINNGSSVINYSVSIAPTTPESQKTLSVTLTGAGITTTSLTLPITDKDPGHFNYNYHKVQLPYFNDVGTGNYTGNNVVTGWIIKSMTNGTQGSFTTGSDVTFDEDGNITSTPYNFADRNTYAKDIYSASNPRVFSQGAYFDVPNGVTGITIEPYWGKAAYICDPNYDVLVAFITGSNAGNVGTNVEALGTQGNSLLPSGQTIYTDVTTALESLSGSSVYDNALVLVGNLHLYNVPSEDGDKAFTIMSADFDKDNEPDYSLIYTHYNRTAVSPIRFDFLNVPGMAMAQKPKNATTFRNVSIFKPKGWFEVTNTCQISFVQFEYDNGGKASATSSAPLILLGGEFEQFVSTQNTNINADDYKDRTSYIHVGSNVYFKEFNNGTHSDGWYATKHIPISVTGGDYDNFYLSGAYRPDAQVVKDNAECYISGGNFGEVAGAGQQQIDGNVYWQIYNADIREFYGGGVNSDKPITGNIIVDIYNSHVTTYCGGPKFGDMQKQGSTTITWARNKDGSSIGSRQSTIDTDRSVTTNATGCEFGRYFGAGFGGIAYVRKRTRDATTTPWSTWEGDYTGIKGNYYNGTSTHIGDNATSDPKGSKAGPGVAVDFDYEFFVWSSGATGGRFYVKFASLSFATTNDVVSNLNDCDITGNFYGGGNLGKVDGTITSTLNGCRIGGNVFGAGYSASTPKVPYRNGGFANDKSYPDIDTNAGVFIDGVKSTNVVDLDLNPGISHSDGESAIGTSGKIDTDFSENDLKALGTVSGVVTLNINNYTANSNTVQSVITGDVFGGGAMSKTTSNVNVNISGGSVGNVYGGGDQGAVGGNTIVTLSGNATINGNVFGGGNKAAVTGSATVNIVEQ